MTVNQKYASVLTNILRFDNLVTTRNSKTYMNPFLDNIVFDEFPLVTVRKTAWKSALSEMEWFLSGISNCPENLLKWWDTQLNFDNELVNGYGSQLRYSTFLDVDKDKQKMNFFDQIKYILDGLKNHPHSRRLLTTTWNTGEMATITKANDNPNSPSCCHGTITQFFVVNGYLHMKTYNRSSDTIIGLPHNWVQYWALLKYFAYHSDLKVGNLIWMFGDAHVYAEESHIQAATEIILNSDVEYDIDLEYNYSGDIDEFETPKFLASDFRIIGEIPNPIVTVKPKLL